MSTIGILSRFHTNPRTHDFIRTIRIIVMIKNIRHRPRCPQGSALVEMGPALLILLMFLFFPLTNVIAVGVMYGSCMTLNSLQLREAALLPASQAQASDGPIKKAIPDAWASAGLGRFVKPVHAPATTVTYKDGPAPGSKIVIITTSLQCSPFVPTPFIPNVPGLSSPIAFVLKSERPVENPNNVEL